MQIIYNDVADHFCEWVYIQEVLKYLKPKLSDEYVLHIACLSQECSNYKNIKFIPGKKNIILGTSDEYMEDVQPHYIDKSVAIFKQYLVPHQEINNVYSLPLGYNQKYVSFENKTINDRAVDVFFSGHMHSKLRKTSLLPIIQYFKNLPKDKRPKLDMNISSGFNMGLKGDEYSKRLHNSKIAICPHGNVSVETFRHYEAIRSGCVVVSPSLPNTEIYKNSNVVQVENWHTDTGPIIMELLQDSDKLTSIQRGIQDDWNNTLCERAAANKILSKLQQ